MNSRRAVVLAIVAAFESACRSDHTARVDRPAHVDAHFAFDAETRPHDANDARYDASEFADVSIDVARTSTPDVADAARTRVVGPMPLTAVPNVFEAGAARPTIDRPLASNLAAGARIEVRFDVESGSHRTRTATYQTLTGVLRAPQLGIERRMGGSTAPTSCESRVEAGERAMFFRCAGDVEDAHGRVWIEGDRLMLVSASSREDARPSDTPDGTIERFALPPGASVRFHASRGALGM